MRRCAVSQVGRAVIKVAERSDVLMVKRGKSLLFFQQLLQATGRVSEKVIGIPRRSKD